MSEQRIVFAAESSCYDTSLCFRVGRVFDGGKFVVGSIGIGHIPTGSIDPEPFQNQPPRFKYELFVQIYDTEGALRWEFPRKNAVVEWARR